MNDFGLSPTLLAAIALRDLGFVPHALATVGTLTVECISYPFPRDDGSYGMLVRTTPGDPTSMIEVTIPPIAADLTKRELRHGA